MEIESVVPYVVRMTDGNIIKLEYHKHLPSTSAFAKEYATRGYPDRYVVLAENTDAGAESGIYMSVILRPSIFPSQAVFIGPCAAVAAASALKEHSTKSVGIGWVSDLYCDSHYIGGINVEGKLDNFTSYEYLIINFSLKLDKESFPPRLTDMIRKVFESESASIAMIIAKNILAKFFSLYTSIKSPQKIMNSYKNLFALRGESVKCLRDGFPKTCKVLGVDGATCALIVEERGGKITNVTTPTGVVIPKRLKNRKQK